MRRLRRRVFVRYRPGMCGKPGHWKNECPEPVATNNKISSLSYCAELECISISMDVHQATGSLQGDSALVHDSQHNVFSSASDARVSPVWRLRNLIQRWVEITDGVYILDVMRLGYKIALQGYSGTGTSEK
ncbi:hypothetical protein DPMN_081943 [Dreissena polymorpha]|uniref:CCHC-type domain-containing protein n=1 Tax=Dreissena polymorpha TaxID=45954 RepID=A0A9D3Y611_DREPO|nr:hypothetical protein DPMN_081943 [Dreissena polymorpha]